MTDKPNHNITKQCSMQFTKEQLLEALRYFGYPIPSDAEVVSGMTTDSLATRWKENESGAPHRCPPEQRD